MTKLPVCIKAVNLFNVCNTHVYTFIVFSLGINLTLLMEVDFDANALKTIE